jgi:hypothetical protein
MENNLAYHYKKNHIDVKYHLVRDMVEDKKALQVKVDTLRNIVDSLTWSISTKKFSWCRGEMSIGYHIILGTPI